MSSENSPMMSKITTPRVVVWGFVVLLVAVFATTTQADVLLRGRRDFWPGDRHVCNAFVARGRHSDWLFPGIYRNIGRAPTTLFFRDFPWWRLLVAVFGADHRERAISMTGLGMQIALRIFQRTGDFLPQCRVVDGVQRLGARVVGPGHVATYYRIDARLRCLYQKQWVTRLDRADMLG